MNINEHAKYYKSLSLFFLLPFLPLERLVGSPESQDPLLLVAKETARDILPLRWNQANQWKRSAQL